MAQWDDGYVTDVAYTSHFYREITPNWIASTSLLLGQRPPDLAAPFSYADLGCGKQTELKNQLIENEESSASVRL